MKRNRKAQSASWQNQNTVAAQAGVMHWNADMWLEFGREVGLRFAALVSGGFAVLLLISLGAWMFPFQSPFIGCEHGCQMTFRQTVQAVWWIMWTPMLMSCMAMSVVQAFVYLRFPEGQAYQRNDVILAED